MATEVQVLDIRSVADPGTARRAARAMALALGFDNTASEEIAIVTSELATNLLKYAQNGTLTLTPLTADRRAGIQIESRDTGPGIADVDEAVADGFSTSGSLGVGLGTVNRLMDEFDIVSHRGTGTRITCKRWVRAGRPLTLAVPLDFGVASRPRSGITVNGDSFVVKQWEHNALVGVIDGLGHGEPAHRAAETARHYIEAHFDQPIASLFRGVGYACRGTRGVVMALARFDWMPLRLTFGSVGNIETRVVNTPRPLDFPVRRGIIGNNAPAADVITNVWDVDAILILHSDGLRSHWQWTDFLSVAHRSASAIAQKLLESLAREEDDATVLVVKKGEGI